MAVKKPAPAPIAPQPDYKQVYNQYYGQISGEVNKYVDELIGQAQGDYDFAAKWIETNYKLALGSDDGAAANFLKQVANTLEEKVGRIAFDYQTGTYRTNQDADLATNRTVRNRDMALQRLSQDETAFKQDYDREAGIARDSQNADLNARGILTTSRDRADGLAGREIRNLESGLTSELDAYNRILERDRQDINLSSGDQLQDIGIVKNRSLEDLTTGARREGIDETNQRQYNLDSAKRVLEQQKLEAEKQRRSLLNQSRSYADYYARGATNLG